MSGAPAGHTPAPRQQFNSGRELINAVKARREEATAYWKIAKELEGELADLDAYDTERIDGVKVLWLSKDQRAARDETAFRHALRSAHKLRAAGNRMTDAAIIDAYEHAYNVAQQVGADGRASEMPAMRDRQTMARRVRGYVLAGNQTSTPGNGPGATQGTASSRERKALATMGRKGGKKAAQRWKDRDNDYTTVARAPLEKANAKRALGGRVTARQIANYFDEALFETGKYPTVAEASQAMGVSTRTVQRAVKSAGIALPTGRRKKGDRP